MGRATDIPDKFKDLLLPNKMQYVISTGNVGSRETIEWLENLAAAKSQAHIVKGDFDEANLPETKVVQIGNFNMGIKSSRGETSKHLLVYKDNLIATYL